MRTAPFVSLLFLAAALGGCVGGEGAEPASATGAGPAEFDETTGAVEGLVHDDALVPIEGAEVGLLDAPEFRAMTDVEGRFVLSRVPPGEHQLAAQRIGFQTASRLVTVTAHESTVVDIPLVASAVVQPHFGVKDQRGLFGCGASWRPAVGYSGVAACGVLSLPPLNQTQYDHFLLIWNVTGPMAEWDGAAFEMTWKSTQTFGRGLAMIWETNECSNVRNSTFGRDRGASPLQDVLNTTRLDAARENNTEKSNCDEKSNCSAKKCELQSRVFSEPDTLGASSPADVGITVQQSFAQYMTEFYNLEPPPGYTAIKDA